MSVKLLTEYHFEFLILKGGCTDLSDSALAKLPHCWKSHVMAQLCCAHQRLFLPPYSTHPGSGTDRTIASERQNTALATLYIGGSVTCSQKKTQGA